MALLNKTYGNTDLLPKPTQSPISAEEDAKIKNWVNNNYQGQSSAIKSAAYKDAYNAVLERKEQNKKKTANEVRRQINANAASYKGDDKVKKEQAKLAKAEMAISDAADIIREGQKANGARVNEDLTDKQTVDSFLLANNGQPYAEYVSKYLEQAMNGKADNMWLATKLGLDRGTTLGIDNRTLTDLNDKRKAAMLGVGQGLTNLTQNTLGRTAEYVGSHIGAGAGELAYAVADLFGADTSEGSVWDKLKKAKAYSWKEAGDAANSHLGDNVLSEDKGIYNIGEGIGETAAEIALTAPLELGVGSAITAGKIGKTALNLSKAGKFGLQAANAGATGVGYQLLEDLSDKEKVDNRELSSLKDYATTAGLSAATAGASNLLGGTSKALKKASLKEIGKKVFGASDRFETAILTKSPKEFDNMMNIAENFSKDANAAVTPYTELTKPLKQAKETLDIDRLNKGRKLQDVRQNLEYIGKERKTGSKYTREDVKNDLNAALKNLADEKKYGKAAKNIDQIPQFEIKNGKLGLSDNGIEELNKFELVGINGKQKDVKLGDEIVKLYNRVYSMGGKDNAANTHAFIQELKSLYKQGWNGGEPNLLREVINSLDSIETKFNNSLSSKTLKNLQTYSKLDEDAINLSNDFEKMIGAMEKGDVEDVKAAVKAMKGNQTTEELFKKVKEATGVDMNNEILSWAYTISLYDVRKANELLTAFYPSKAGMIETVIKTLSDPARRWAAKEQVKTGVRKTNTKTSTDALNTAFTQIANIINANNED